MKDVEKTVGNLIDKVGVSFIASIDREGFSNMKAMLPPRRREGIKYIYFTTNTNPYISKSLFDAHLNSEYDGASGKLATIYGIA